MSHTLVSARHRRAARWRAAAEVAGVLLLCTALCWPIERFFEPANLIMVYLAGVVVVALRRGRAAALATVLGSIALFDLIYVAPRWGLNPIDPQYWFTFAVMLAVGWLIGHLAARAREQAVAAEQRAQRAQALKDLALRLSAARSDAAVAAALIEAADSALGLRVELRWAADVAPAGGGLVALPLYRADTLLATLWHPPLDPQATTPEDQQLLEAFAHQTTLALERAWYEQRSARSAVQAEGERLRNTLLAGISHDFRTPLTTIVGSVTSLLDQENALDAEHRRSLLRGVLGEARRLHALSSDLLDLNRLQDGAVQLAPEWCPADELVEEARLVLGQRLAAHQLQVQLDPEAVVWCDPRLAGQALVNLLDNAVRHTPVGGRITLGIRIGQDHWHLQVQDQGPGLPPGAEHEVFQKFFRGPGAVNAGGTGLGLALCEAVVRLHGGQIVAFNDGGACFRLTLPQPAGLLDPGETP